MRASARLWLRMQEFRYANSSRISEPSIVMKDSTCFKFFTSMESLLSIRLNHRLKFRPSQLPACGIDLVSFALANLHVQAGRLENLDKTADRRFARRLVRQTAHGVIRDEIDKGQSAAQQFRQ